MTAHTAGSPDDDPSDDPDAPWKPGYVWPEVPRHRAPGEPEVADGSPNGWAPPEPGRAADAVPVAAASRSVDDVRADDDPAAGDGGASSRSRRSAIAIVLLLFLLAPAIVMAIVALRGIGSGERASPVVEPGRLPLAADELWSVDLDGFVVPGGFVIADGVAVGVVSTIDDSSAELVAIDVTTGVIRWTTRLESDAGLMPMAARADAVVLSSENFGAEGRVAGYDITSGELRWERIRPDGTFVAQVFGTTALAEVSDYGTNWAIFDPGTGDTVTEIQGDFISADMAGGAYFVDGRGQVLRFDSIASDGDGRLGPVEPVAETEPDVESVLPLDARLFSFLSQPGLDVVEVTLDGERPVTVVDTRPGDQRDDGPADLDEVQLLGAIGVGDRRGLLVDGSGDGAVFGCTVVGDVLEIDWSAEGLLTGLVMTDDGPVLNVERLIAVDDDDAGDARARDGLATHDLIDGSTGSVLAAYESPERSGGFGAAANGVVVRVALSGGETDEETGGWWGSGTGTFRAFGLGGAELWTIDDVDDVPLVGDGVVVVSKSDIDADDGGATTTMRAYGDAGS